MKKPLLTKSQRALQELEHATTSINKALSLLGGRTRHKPRAWPNTQFTCRQYLEGIQARLDVVINTMSGLEAKSFVRKQLATFNGTDAAFPRDDFEATYDRERNPQC